MGIRLKQSSLNQLTVSYRLCSQDFSIGSVDTLSTKLNGYQQTIGQLRTASFYDVKLINYQYCSGKTVEIRCKVTCIEVVILTFSFQWSVSMIMGIWPVSFHHNVDRHRISKIPLWTSNSHALTMPLLCLQVQLMLALSPAERGKVCQQPGNASPQRTARFFFFTTIMQN